MEKEVSDSERRILVRKKFLEKISYLLTKDIMDQKELYSTVRGFFSEFLKLDYEFTYEELSMELNKVFIKPNAKKEIDNFLYDLSESEYLSDKDLEQAEIKNFLTRLQSLIQTLVSEENITVKKPTILERLFKKNPHDEKKQISPEPEVVQTERRLANEKFPIPALTRQTVAQPLPEAMNESMPAVPQQLLDMRSGIDNQFIPADVAKENLLDVRKENLDMQQQLFAENKAKDITMTAIKPEPAVMNVAKAEPIAKIQQSKSQSLKTDTAKKPDIAPKMQKIQDALMIETNKPELVRIHELMEESYMNISYNNPDTAKINYLNALDIYHELLVEDKKQVYADLYELFRRLKNQN